MLNKLAFGTYNSRIENAKTESDWLSTQEDCVEKYIQDPLCGFTFTVNGFRTLFKLILNLHDERMLAGMPKDLPVLFAAGEEDPVGDYGKTPKMVAEAFTKMGMDVQLKLYPGDRHELLNEKDRENVMQDILCWLKSQEEK